MSEPRDPTPPDDAQTRDQVVVCGLGHLGLRTVEELLLRDEAVTAIADSADHELDAERLPDVRVIVGDCRRERILRQAGIETAVAIVLTGDDDLGNLQGALAAHDLNPDIRIVIRMFDGELGARIQALLGDAVTLSSSALAAPGFVAAALDGEGGSRFELAGRQLVARATSLDHRAGNVPSQGGDPAVPLARIHPDRTVELFPEADPTEPGLIVLDTQPPEIAAARPATPRRTAAVQAARRSLAALPGDLRGRLSSPDRRLINLAVILTVLAVVSATFFLVVANLTPLDAISFAISLLTGAGSGFANLDERNAPAALKVYGIFLSLLGAAIVAVVYALITDAIIRSRLLQTLGRRTVPASIRDHVIVCGLGTIGYRVALGSPRAAYRSSSSSPTRTANSPAAVRSHGIPVVIGDARQPEILKAVGIVTARAMVAATSDDLVNIAAALHARTVRPDLRVVVRLYDPDFALRVQRGLGMRFTRSVSHLAAAAFAAAATGSHVAASVPVGDRRVVLFAQVQVPAAAEIAGRQAAIVDQTGERRLLAIIGSDGHARWHPRLDEPLVPGSELVVAATARAWPTSCSRPTPEERADSVGLVVDLGALEPAAEVDVDRLPLGVGLEGGVAGLAMTVPVSLVPPNGRWVSAPIVPALT